MMPTASSHACLESAAKVGTAKRAKEGEQPNGLDEKLTRADHGEQGSRVLGCTMRGTWSREGSEFERVERRERGARGVCAGAPPLRV
jgi:hypothetical protein